MASKYLFCAQQVGESGVQELEAGLILYLSLKNLHLGGGLAQMQRGC